MSATAIPRLQVPHGPFGGTGLQVSRLGLGTAPAGLLGKAPEVMRSLIETCRECGINLIDTAPAYGSAEEELGRTLGKRRDRFVIVGKCGDASSPEDHGIWSPRRLRQSIDATLKRLRTDHIDVMLLHSCSKEILARGDAVQELVRARKQGKIRHAGYAGDNDAAALAAVLDDLEVLELSLNICDQRNLTRVVPLARERNIAVIAKRPLANLAWRPEASVDGIDPGYIRPYRRRLTEMGLADSRAPAFAGWPEIALRFVLSFPGVHTAITGTTLPDHLRYNSESACKGQLPPASVEFLRDQYQQESAGSWPALT